MIPWVTKTVSTACLIAALGAPAWLLGSPGAAEAAGRCARAVVSGGNRPIDPARIDKGLLNAAVVAEVNYYRCLEGVQSVSASRGLRKAAQYQADWMARTRDVTHQSGFKGKRTLLDRLMSSGVKLSTGYENIARVSLYQIDGIGRFVVKDRSACHFETRRGTPLPRHSYTSLAQYITKAWYESPTHHHNMMAREVDRTGFAVEFDAGARLCGVFYISQTLAG